jgi:hypothetical protein
MRAQKGQDYGAAATGTLTIAQQVGERSVMALTRVEAAGTKFGEWLGPA